MEAVRGAQLTFGPLENCFGYRVERGGGVRGIS